MKLPIDSFETHREQINPEIVRFFTDAGAEVIEAYGSVDLLHNTHEAFLPSILKNGLDPQGVDIPQDYLDFATELFISNHGIKSVSRDQFDRYILGETDTQERGIYFYTPSFERYNSGYGFPERLHILSREMSYVANTDGFSPSIQQKARAIGKRILRGLVEEDTHIAVLNADPFAAPIINYRLKNIMNLRDVDSRKLLEILPIAIEAPWGGICIPERIDPADIEVETLLPFNKEMFIIDTPASRRFYCPLD